MPGQQACELANAYSKELAHNLLLELMLNGDGVSKA